ncbi:MAG: Mannose-1-phosphate guanylyltransferase / Phosphomannomutase [Ktedonobacterales bacterium]|jgi:mannose-1-phosphate guanylyltransferase/phosphomannomutase|nr:MAG: Mannose-1-phosphate guanylyltransferase / Phosphomannomutase [Ktedonobacterales bacterium]
MKAVVMAGGEGSRLRPLTVTRPKPMVPIVGRPVMEHILNLLKFHGITDVVVTVQYMASAIEDYFGDGASFGMNINYSREEVPLGTAGSVKNAEEFLDEPFIVISGDALTDFNLSDIIQYHQERKSLATLTLAHVANPLEYGVIIADDHGHITQFLEKPSWGEVFSDTINTGIYLLDPVVFDYIEKDKQVDFSQDVFPAMLKKGDPIYGYVASGYWCDVGNLAEYMKANADVLQNRVNAPLTGTDLGGGVWAEEGVEIAPDAQIFGPVWLGHDCKIKSGVMIHGPSVVGPYSIVDDRAQIDRSVVWNNSYLGERAELRGALVGSATSIKSKAVMFEGAVVGDHSVIDEGAIIQPGVKIWPNKEIETGAVVTSSIIWGSQGRRALFGRYGVTGLVNVDITPDFAAKLGAAFGAVLPKGSVVCVNRDDHRTPRMVKRAIISGLPSAGINVWDLESVPIPVARHYVRTTDSAGGVHIRLSPYDPRIVDIKFLDGNGFDISKNVERKIENLFFREDFRRVYLDDIGTISYAPAVNRRYIDAFLQHIDQEVMRKRRFRLVVDYGQGSSVDVLSPIFNAINADVIALNATRDPARYSRTADEFDRDMQILASITGTLKADLGVRIDTGGERIYMVDDSGQLLDGGKLLAAMTELMLRERKGGKVAAPVTAPSVVETVAARYGGSVVYTKVQPHALTSAATSAGMALVGDGVGSFVFPEFQPVFDGMFATLKLLESLARFGTTLSDVVAGLPPYHLIRIQVNCPWEYKGKVMRILSEQYRERREQPIDGVKIDLGEEWVLVLPDADRPLFHVLAESRSRDAAQALADKYARVVSGLQH